MLVSSGALPRQHRWSIAVLILASIASAALVMSPLAAARPVGTGTAPAHGIVAQTGGLTGSLYWGADRRIGTASTDGTNVNRSVSTACLADYWFFASATKMYGRVGDNICSQDLDGGNLNASVLDTDCAGEPIAGFTATASHLYYTCVRGKWIGRANLDGSNNNPRFAVGVDGDYPYSLTTDANWLYIGYSYTGFRRVDLESGGPVDPTFGFYDGMDMRGVAVDRQYIYWTGPADKYVHRANLDGTGINSTWLDTQSPGEVWGVNVDGSSVYWTSRNPGTVGKANLDGTGVQPALITGITATGENHHQNHQISVIGGTAKVPLGAAIVNTAVPTVSGTVAVGETLTATSGTWASPPDQRHYAWQVSADSGTTWSSATGAGVATSSYRVVIADIGKTLRVKVRAGANNGLLTSVYSLATIAVPAPPAPVNTVVPSFDANGLVAVGLKGTWTNSVLNDLTFTYQWQVSPTGTGWTDATGPGSNSSTYLVQSADSGNELRICVTGFNGTSATQCSAAATAPTPTAAFGRVYLKSYSVLGDGSSRQGYTNPGGVWGFSSNGVTNVWAGWTDLFSHPAGGGTPTSLTSYGSGAQGGTLVDDQYIYLSLSGAIKRMKIDGTDPRPAFITGDVGNALYMARDAHYLYWAQGNGVSRAPITGGPKDANWNLQFASEVAGVAVDGDYIYGAINMDGRGVIARADIGGSGVENAWAETAFSGFAGLGVDRNGLYVRARDGSCIGLVYIALDGSASACVRREEDDTWALAVVPAAADAGLLPVNTGGANAPAIMGTPAVGDTLSASTGTWTNTPGRYTYRWLMSDDGETGWTAVIDESGTTEELDIPQACGGKYVKVRVIAHNGSTWSDPAYSAAVRVPVPSEAPVDASPGVTPPAETPAATPAETPAATPPVFSPAPGITVGETRGEAILAAATPAAGADLLRGANIWVRPTSEVEYVLPLPSGLTLVNGKLVASKPGTYKVKLKVKRKNGTIKIRTIKIKVGSTVRPAARRDYPSRR